MAAKLIPFPAMVTNRSNCETIWLIFTNAELDRKRRETEKGYVLGAYFLLTSKREEKQNTYGKREEKQNTYGKREEKQNTCSTRVRKSGE
nr:hypothetical protein [Tanacetum cinerariifolium]